MNFLGPKLPSTHKVFIVILEFIIYLGAPQKIIFYWELYFVLSAFTFLSTFDKVFRITYGAINILYNLNLYFNNDHL